MSNLISPRCPEPLERQLSVKVKDRVVTTDVNNLVIVWSAISTPGALVGAGVAWLVSSVTTPLVAAIFVPVTTAVALIAVRIFEEMGIRMESSILPATVASNIMVSLISSAVGFPVSIPLSLLMVAINVAVFGMLVLVTDSL